MNLNQQQISNLNSLLLQKRERKISENLNNPQIDLNTIEIEETESTKPSAKNSENKNSSITNQNVTQPFTKNNQEFNIIPPTTKHPNSRKISLNSTDSRTICNCKNSQCLKLYCECFSMMSYCDPKLCSCRNCMNTVDNEETRKNAINNYFIKSPNSFKKIFTSQLYGYNNNSTTNIPTLDVGISVIRGCTCKKSNCLKRYCECFQSGLTCNPHCKCLSCKNTKNEKGHDNQIYSNSNSNLNSFSTFQKFSRGKLSVNMTDDSSSNYKFNENNISNEDNGDINKIHNNFCKKYFQPQIEFEIQGESQIKQNFSNFNFVNRFVYEKYNNSSDDYNFIKCNNTDLVSLKNSNNPSKNLRKNNKNSIFDKIFFERKKEEITPYKIIINDYVIKKEYEVDNNL